VVFAGAVCVLPIGWLLLRNGAQGRWVTPVDRAAFQLATRRQMRPLTRRPALRSARRLGLEQPGLLIGTSIRTRQELYAPWEWLSVDIWGPRTGKTTARAIPTLLAAPGAGLGTSNKPDLYQATAGLRAVHGRVWNFDLQSITTPEPPGWWWNPLSYVTDEQTAAELADTFVGAYRDANARTDAFFDQTGTKLVTFLLLAAALDGRPVQQALDWANRPTEYESVGILAQGGHQQAAVFVREQINAPHDQRGGVFATAAGILAFLSDPKIEPWVTDPGGSRAHLDLAEFVESTDTLYLHSKEGAGSSSGLVSALTMAVCAAADQLAARSPSGRLQRPIVGVLDEAANICRWPALPDLYSHYGSRGVLLQVILQSWTQGCKVWGEDGMTKMWSAANLRIYGGGAIEAKFLSDLETICGTYNRPVRTHNRSQQHGGQMGGSHTTSSSTQLTDTPILTAADLAALPPGRQLVIPSGIPPVLITTRPWWKTHWAKQIEVSRTAYDPATAHARHHNTLTATPTPPPTDTGPGASANPWLA
jgi:type IV secretory pathway TraG/TraD family ATPase VirD4